MRFRMGLTLGFCAGYVMGSKAGRERYQQIKEWTDGMMASPQFEKVREQASHTIEMAAHKLPESVLERLPEAIKVQKIPEPEYAAPAQEPFTSSPDSDGRF